MNLQKYKEWLGTQGLSPKMQKDYVSRLKAIQEDVYPYYDINEEYSRNHCIELLRLFKDKGFLFKLYCNPVKLPIGKPYLSAYKLALKSYIQFLDEIGLNE